MFEGFKESGRRDISLQISSLNGNKFFVIFVLVSLASSKSDTLLLVCLYQVTLKQDFGSLILMYANLTYRIQPRIRMF